MRRSQVTMKDLAKSLGLSTSTVSRALKDHPEISQETIEKVKALAKELKYLPNTVALSLRKKRSNTIGVIVPKIAHYFFSTVISGIEDVAEANGYTVIVSQTNELYNKEVAATQALFNNRVDGMLISVARETEDFEHLQGLYQRGMPLVFFDRKCDAINCSKVIVNDFKGSFEATEHLIKMGYRNIGHLGGPLNLDIHKERFNGYKAAIEKHGLAINPMHVIADHSTDDDTNAEALTLHLLQLPNPPDALFTITDMLALGAAKGVRKMGLEIPKDFGIVGFSNWHITEYSSPTISTVNQPGFEMGKKAAQLLIREINHDNEVVFQPEMVTFETELIIRESSLRPS